MPPSVGFTSAQAANIVEIMGNLGDLDTLNLESRLKFLELLATPQGDPDPITESQNSVTSGVVSRPPVIPGSFKVADTIPPPEVFVQEDLDADGVLWQTDASNSISISGAPAGVPVDVTIGNLGQTGLRPGSCSAGRSGGGLSLNDDGSGNMTGTGGSGTVNYTTGEFSITFDTPGGFSEFLTVFGATDSGTINYETGTYSLSTRGNSILFNQDPEVEYSQDPVFPAGFIRPYVDVPSSGSPVLTLTLADGTTFPLAAALDLRSAFVETKPLDFGDSTVSKYIDGLRALVNNNDLAKTLEVIIKTSNRVEGPYEEWGPFPLDEADKVVRFRLPVAKYYIFRFRDETVSGRWHLMEWEVFGRPAGRRFL